MISGGISGLGLGLGLGLGSYNLTKYALLIYRGVNLVTYFNLFITNMFGFHKSIKNSMKDSLLMN